jgi:hypothetical protein
VGHFSTGDSGQFCTGGYTAKPATVSLYNQALLTGRLKHYVRRCWVASGGLDQRLALWGIDVAALLSQGLYVQLDAGETLSEFMVDGWPRATFQHRHRDLIERVATGGQRRFVRVVGEMVALLWNEGNARGAVRLEDLWNNLAKKIPFTLLCAYPLNTFSRETYGELLGLCAEHSELVPGENETADLHKEIAGTVGLIKKSLADIKGKLASLNPQRSPQQ